MKGVGDLVHVQINLMLKNLIIFSDIIIITVQWYNYYNCYDDTIKVIWSVLGEHSLLVLVETREYILGFVSNSAALFCSSPLLTQWEYISNAQESISFLTNLFS